MKKRRGLAPYTTEQWEIRRKLTYEVARDLHGAERYTGKNWGEPAILAFAAAVLRGKREEADRIKFEQIGPQEGPWVRIPESQALGGRKE